MTQTINDGGPAFPSAPTVSPMGYLYRPADIGCTGLSIRDYFAAKALQGLVANQDDRIYVTPNVMTLEEWRTSLYQEDAKFCYRMADAMLAERCK